MEDIKQNQEVGIFKGVFSLDHSPINAHFSKNSDDFVVREVPLYEFSGNGEHLIINIQKKDLTTFDAIKILSGVTGVKMRDFGYAGLKDRQGMTTQFISMPKKFESSLENFSHEKMKILSTTVHNNKLRIGHLKGNNFFIRLKKVSKVDALKLSEVCKKIDEMGFANYFGYQRFGKYADNAKQGREILEGNLNIKNPKTKDLLISAYQSEVFNIWLSKRVALSKAFRDLKADKVSEIYPLFKDIKVVKSIKNEPNFFKILPGDTLSHYPFGKVFLCEDLESETRRFINRNITVTGLLFGSKALKSVGLAAEFASGIYSSTQDYKQNGTNRFAWEYAKNLEYKYDEENAHFTLSFGLDKGCYATTLLEEILHTREILV
ncbi:tRNA pseudouridine(13) synthase TruD [Campylobacter corcagiensis]|uniref:tRNA pseudouridine synthase D n=1 Tax=Campylobacter corcagiensis TaxID=1448857 RepID=A0A7M1LFH1_9BACT|nr:tRNA pseudouridine(13) synthase TruD [Campylobacter corcagiensis]QKF64492.1 tRNA pseudouridine 13 synthase [Campylobacter corcagiensis]QOQ87327.1 tRNA pseudouridine(13) synthase TruD [Campylobacter corcagiensis]